MVIKTNFTYKSMYITSFNSDREVVSSIPGHATTR